MTKPSVPLTERRYVVPLILVTSLFFLWAFGVNLNDILIPHLKKAFRLSDFRSSLIQTAFFGGYFLAALPAGWLMEKIGYKRGILLGLLTCASGALLFIPAASVRLYGFFLFALFVMACGQGVLEVAANPYVTMLGPPESSERRLNLAQSFNSVGAVVTPIVGAAFILSGVEYSRTQLSAMTPGQLQAFQVAEANTVKGPYLVIAGLFLAAPEGISSAASSSCAVSTSPGRSAAVSPPYFQAYTNAAFGTWISRPRSPLSSTSRAVITLVMLAMGRSVSMPRPHSTWPVAASASAALLAFTPPGAPVTLITGPAGSGRTRWRGGRARPSRRRRGLR